MKKKTASAMAAILMSGIMVLGTDTSLLAAAEDSTEAAVNSRDAADTAETKETDNQDSDAGKARENSEALYGLWNYVWFDNSDYAISGDIMFMPDGNLVSKNGTEVIWAGKYEISGSKITFTDLPEEVSSQIKEMSAEFLPLEDKDGTAYELKEENAEKFFQKTGKDNKVIFTVSYVDETDPLSSKLAESSTVLLKRQTQDTFLDMLFEDSSWNVNGKILNISADGDIDLDNGARTGSYYSNYNNIHFSWDDSNSFTYVLAGMDKDSVTLSSQDDPKLNYNLLFMAALVTFFIPYRLSLDLNIWKAAGTYMMVNSAFCFVDLYTHYFTALRYPHGQSSDFMAFLFH